MAPTSEPIEPGQLGKAGAYSIFAVIFMAVMAIAFLSIRRAHATRLLDKFTDYTRTHFPFLYSYGAIRLSNSSSIPPEEHHFDLSDSDSERDEQEDELPSSVAPPPPSLSQRSRRGVEGFVDRLGWNQSGGFGKDDWFSRAFNARKRLSGSGIRMENESRRGTLRRPQLNLAINGVLDRVSGAAGAGYQKLSSYTASPLPASPKVSSSPRLFDLGEEDEGSDAVELPHEFSLPSRKLGASPGGGS